jgi:lysophospholipase L1-like esterase
VLNQGISGDQAVHTTCGIGRRLHLVARARPSSVFLLIGINDLANERRSAAELAAAMEAFLPRLIGGLPGVRVVVQTLLPVRERYLWLLPQIREANERLMACCHRHGIELLDTHAVMADAAGHLREDYSADGLHLTPAAYTAWTRVLEQALNAGGGADAGACRWLLTRVARRISIVHVTAGETGAQQFGAQRIAFGGADGTAAVLKMPRLNSNDKAVEFTVRERGEKSLDLPHSAGG